MKFADVQRAPVGGDVILAVDGTEVDSFEDLASYLALETTPGDTVRVRVLRDETEQIVEVTLSARPERSETPLR